MRRRYDPVDAQLRAAQALLDHELDRSWLAELDPERVASEMERGLERLAIAESIAAEAWPARPASWIAPMVLGGARYLSAVRGGETRLMGKAEEWEKPLTAARGLAPAEDGPVRLLAAAYLGNWSSLGTARREATVALLERAFVDRRTFQLLVGDWLRVAPSRSRALDVIPDAPWAWRLLQELFSSADDWELFAAARQRWFESLAVDADRQLEEIAHQIERGELADSRNHLLRLVSAWPRSRDFAPRFERLLAILPPGPPNSESSKAFSEWLAWALELCLIDACPLEASAVSRLALLSGDIEPRHRAAAYLVAGDAARASLLERRFAAAGGHEWATYFQLKARHLADSGDVDAAAAALERISPSRRVGSTYWLTAARVAHADDDLEALTLAEERLASLRRAEWTPARWRAERATWILELLPGDSSSGAELEVTGVGREGAAVEVHFDDRLLDVRWVSRSPQRLRFELPLDDRPHRLRVRLHGHGQIRPGTVRLL